MTNKPSYEELENKIKELENEVQLLKKLDINEHTKDADEIKRQKEQIQTQKEELLQFSEELAAQKDYLREINRQFKKSERKLSDIIDFLPDAALVVDNVGKITLWNKEMEHLAGVKSHEITLKGSFEKVKPYYESINDLIFKPLEEVQNKYQIVEKRGEIITAEASFIDSKGNIIYCNLTATPLFDREKNIIGAVQIIRNITERKKMEEELTEAKIGAEVANRAKSEFLANMSHEIRTPMNAILGFGEILEEKIGENPLYQEYIKGITTAGKNLLRLINDILDLSKIEAGRLEIQNEPMNPESVVNEIKQIFELKATKKGIALIINITNSPGVVILDETRVRQILFNLVGNAIKFTETGSVTISFNTEYSDETNTVDLFFEVKDTGIGIQKHQHALIFEPFRQQSGQRTKIYGGTGLGLSITKRLVEMMKGSISVESEVNEGAAFRVHLPNVDVSNLNNEDIQKNREFDVAGIQFQGSTILLVEDIESNRQVIRGYMQSHNIKILEAGDGLEAIQMVREHRPGLVLMDIQMPIMDGHQAIKILKADPDLKVVPIIALTASAMKHQKEEIQKICEGYLKKPVAKNELIYHLAKFLPHIKEHKAEEKSAQTTDFKNYMEVLRQYPANEFPQELISLFINELKPIYDEIKETLSMDETEDFATRIVNTSNDFDIPALTEYGKRLTEAVQNFQLDFMEELIKQYDEIQTIIIGEHN